MPLTDYTSTKITPITQTSGAQSTLVHYDNPIMIDTTLEQYLIKHNKLQNNTELILNNVLPPRQWYDKQNQLWLQYVSTTPGTVTDVNVLLENINATYNTDTALDINLYNNDSILTQCFNEVIRHILLSCSERGILLVNIRDSLYDTLTTYNKLYQSIISNAMYTVLNEQQRSDKFTEQYNTAVQIHTDLQQQIEQYTAKLSDLELKHTQQRTQKQKQHQDTIHALKQTNAQLTTKLQQLLKIDNGSSQTEHTTVNKNAVTV